MMSIPEHCRTGVKKEFTEYLPGTVPTAKDTAVSTFKEFRDRLGRANVVQF